MPSYDTELAFAKGLAAKASEIALKFYSDSFVEFVAKTDDSPVTIADQAINTMVIEGVQQHFPQHGVLGEEESWHPERPLTWVCDPIDATMSFMMRMPTFMFSIALIDDGQPVVAVTANPVTGEIFWATKSGGAYRNGEPIHVSERQLSDAWLAFPSNSDTLMRSSEVYSALRQQIYMADAIHGSVFKGMIVAQGSCDGSVSLGNVQPWDAVAVALLVTEAGGRVTNIYDKPHRYDSELKDGFIISNGVIHDELLSIISLPS